MDHREESFRRKFNSAAQCLNVSSDQIVSLKFRENVGSYEEYRHLVERLRQEADVQCSDVDGEFQGRGYLLSIDKAKLILVEHETGLEILYIAGSIASLVALVPIVLQGWEALRGRFWRRNTEIDHSVEIRRIDQLGHLYEEHLRSRHLMVSLTSMETSVTVMTATASLVESEMRNIVQRLETIGSRVDALEKQMRRKQEPLKEKTPKPRASRLRSQRTRKPR